MAEYYAVLSRAVASLEGNTPEARRAVYDKARNALIAQLKAIVPPLPTSEISRQRLELEEAIRRAEREASSGTGPPLRAARRPAPPPPPQSAPPPQAFDEPEPEAEEIDDGSPQEVFRRAIREAENRGEVPPPIERAPPPQRSEPAYGDMAAEFHVADRPRRAPARGERGEPVAYVPPPDYRTARRPEPEPRLAPDYGWDPEPPAAEPMSRYSAGPYVDAVDRPAKVKGGRRRGGGGRSVDADFEDVDPRPSRLPTILLLVLIVAMVGGLAALAWSQRGAISEILSAFDTSSGTQSAPPAETPAVPAAAADASGKNSDRLLDGGSGVATTPGVRVVDQQPADAGSGAAAVASQDATPQQPAGASGDALVAQKAVLYEEPLDSAKAAAGVTQINAAVTWSYVDNGTDGPSIVANLDAPDRGLKIKLTIRKNTDQSLPASHLIEVVTNATSAFPGKGIGSVPRLVMKPAEDARGQPLIGASAKVADGFFWIALSALDSDVQNNLALLKDRGWIDLPLVYDTGQRAILTFEKGTPGDRVFAKAMAAWSGAG